VPADALASNHFRFRISPDVSIAMGMTVMSQGEKLVAEPAEMLASHHPDAQEMDAYERVLGDAMGGDATLFAREDYVEEAWRIVDPLLKQDSPVYGAWSRQVRLSRPACVNARGSIAHADSAVLFVSKRFDRIDAGRFHCGVDAEDYAYDRRDSKGDEHGGGGDDGLPFRRLCDEPG